MNYSETNYSDQRDLIVINFLRYKRIFIGISIALCTASILTLSVIGLNYGLEFTGGIEIEVTMQPEVNQSVSDAFPEAKITTVNSENHLLIVIPTAQEGTVEDTQSRLDQLSAELGNKIEVLRVDAVGPQIGEELSEQGGLGMLVAILMILVYITLRFQFKFAVGAIVALIHDVLISLLFASILQLTIDMSVIAVLLALIGYSLNDTIVVSDRIRENALKYPHFELIELFELSFNQIFGRTIITSLTTLFVVMSLVLFGGPSLKSFSWLLGIGVIVGTYSSLYVMTNVLIQMKFTAKGMLPSDGDGTST